MNTPEDIKEFGDVPEFLIPGQCITDQIPFTWIESNPQLNRLEIFKDVPHAFIFLLRAIAYDYPWQDYDIATKVRSPKVQRAYTLVRNEYKSSFTIVAKHIWNALQSYPHSVEYLHLHWGFFKPNGEPKDLEEERMHTYAGYLHYMSEQHEIQKWLGLEEILPSPSGSEEIQAKLPSKGRVNRVYRLFRSESLR